MPKRVSTYCRICEAACALQAELDDAGNLLSLRPDKNHPISQGFVCAKGLRFGETAVHPHRLLIPQNRQPDGSYMPTSWETAVTHIGKKLRHILHEHGPHAIGFYFGTPLIHNALGIVAMFRLVRAIGTRNFYSAGSQDNSNKLRAGELLHGSAFMQPIVDIDNADCAILIGTNPVVTQSSYVHFEGSSTAFDRLLARGGRIIVIDPRRTESARRWCKQTDDHLPIRVGSDIILLLTLIHELRSQYQPSAHISGIESWLQLAETYPVHRAAVLTGLTETRIKNLAQIIQETPRTTFLLSVGANQGPFGTLCAIAIQVLAYLSSNFDQAGGLLFQPKARYLNHLLTTHKKSSKIRVDPRSSVSPISSRIGNQSLVGGMMSAGVLADEILTPGPEQIRAMIVIAGNPITSIPGEAGLREAFSSLDLLVTHDLFVNETGALAHWQLPATSWLERWDWAAWQMAFLNAPFLPQAAPVMPPMGTAKTEAAFLGILSLEVKRPLFSSTLLTKLWSHPRLNQWLPRWLNRLAKPWQRKWSSYPGIPFPRPRAKSYLRGKRHISFWPEALQPEVKRLEKQVASEKAIPDAHTFTILGRRRRRGQNSWLHAATHNGPAEAEAWLHPDDMTQLGVATGDGICLFTELGEITLKAVAKEGIPRTTAVVPHGLPRQNINALYPTIIEPLSGMHQLQGLLVQICVLGR